MKVALSISFVKGAVMVSYEGRNLTEEELARVKGDGEVIVFDVDHSIADGQPAFGIFRIPENVRAP